MMERRASRRYEMQLPLLVRAETDGQTEVVTETRDVSSRGVYFIVDRDLPVGSSVEVVLTLPQEITMMGPIRVRCEGRIIRIDEKERQAGKVGVATVIDRYEFLRPEAQPH